jgi:phenylalanyl-tRNA synthetase alpha subunit
MLNTLAIVKKMTAAGMPAAQAEVVAETLIDTVEDTLATKRDLADLQKALKSDIEAVQRELSTDIAAVRRELSTEIAAVRRDMKEEATSHRRDIKELDLKMEKLNAESQRHTVQVGIGMALFIIAVIGFLFRFLART